MLRYVFLLCLFVLTGSAFATDNEASVSSEVLQDLQERIDDETEEVYLQCLADESCSQFLYESNEDENADIIIMNTLNQCLRACSRGQSAIEAFCRTIPLPQIRAVCWANRFSAVACSGFCYAFYD